MMPCLDVGHFHPTESVADKVSALLQYSAELLLHVSRGVRWDYDHVAVYDDTLRDLATEVVRAAALNRVHFALDYFDGSMNRVAAWVIGARATLKALLSALLEPIDRLRELDQAGRLALLEEARAMPLGVIWDYHCVNSGVPPGGAWMDEVRRYESKVLSGRS
jgi:L-rhamnose isomerase